MAIPQNKCPVCKAPPRQMKGSIVITPQRSLHVLNGPVIKKGQRRLVCGTCIKTLHIINVEKRP